MEWLTRTQQWSDEDWRGHLQRMDNRDLLALLLRAESYTEDTEAVRHARHCMLGEILERMGGK